MAIAAPSPLPVESSPGLISGEVVDPWAAPSAFLVPGARVANRYELVTRIARGGMGSIWVALDTGLDRQVAVKFLASGLVDDEVIRDRFFREARAVAMLRTPHVATVYDHGVEEGIPFIVMELLEGEDLQRRLAAVHRLDLPTTARIVTQCARALRLAHTAGIIHRDLKPENIFLARSEDEPSGEIAKVLDFGVAKLMGGPAATAAGMVVGSPHYMSPEQMKGSTDLDARADVWALGVITHIMLTGVRPFEGSITELALQIGRGRKRKPTEIVPGLPPAVDELFDRALAVKRENRFATTVELAEALEQIASASIVAPAVRESLDTPRVRESLDTPRIRESLDTPRVRESLSSAQIRERMVTPEINIDPTPSRPSQRPTLVGVDATANLAQATAQAAPAPIASPMAASAPEPPRPSAAGAFRTSEPAAVPPPADRGWTPIVVGLVAAFMLLLILALVWTP
jgi:serine/threonine protein kinase